MTKKTIMSPIVFTREEYDFLNKVSAEANLSVGEFIRYIVKRVKIWCRISRKPEKSPIGNYWRIWIFDNFGGFYSLYKRYTRDLY
jgi:hypothetical protein